LEKFHFYKNGNIITYQLPHSRHYATKQTKCHQKVATQAHAAFGENFQVDAMMHQQQQQQQQNITT